MADVTIYKPASVSVQVVDGVPPVDQSSLVSQLQADNAALQGQVAALTAKLSVAKVEAQQTVDALA